MNAIKAIVKFFSCPDEDKFCKDCKHVERDASGNMVTNPMCYSTKNGEYDLVTGKYKYVKAAASRCYACGPNAREFEPFEPKDGR